MYAKFGIENMLLSSHCSLAHSEAQPKVGAPRLRFGPAADYARIIYDFIALYCMGLNATVIIFLTISVKPIISTFTRPVLMKFAGKYGCT